MKRRDFIKRMGMLAGAGAVSMTLGNTPLRAFGKSLFNIQAPNGKILVLLQLSGGNDGLNTVIPYTDTKYFTVRPNIAIPAANVVTLNTQTGLHPSLQPLKTLYDNGQMLVVQNVGYANPNRSHFRATDIWMSASDSTQMVYDGWAGRHLMQVFPEFPVTYPEHPMAIQLGSVQSLVFDTASGSTSVAFEDPNAFYQLVSGGGIDNDPPPNTVAGNELKFLKQIAASSVQYATVIKAKSDLGSNTVTYPTTKIGTQLKIIADLISGGLKTPVYMATLGGFDTHSGQLTSHANLMKQLADSVLAFQRDLNNQGLQDKVLVMTFSEFGRRVNENGSAGTDHGTAAPMLLFGGNLNGGILGNNANLNDLDGNGDLKYVYDYRQLYATVLKDHFGMTSQQVSQTLFRNFTTLPILASPSTGIIGDTPVSYSLQQNYPNPFNPETTISFTIANRGNVTLKVYDVTGREIATLLDDYRAAGEHKISFNASSLPSGVYFYRLTSGSFTQTKKMELIK